MKVANWANFPWVDAEIRSFNSPADIERVRKDWDSFIPRGMGRCYGDSSLAPHILSTLSFDRFLEFDESTGVLTCESGVTYEEILKIFVPKGWFPPVTPGTKFVSIGGAVASDIHGKNHHSMGTFSRHVISLRLLTGKGEILNCSREENADAFWATCGGMGLTGIILNVTFKLMPIETAYIREDSIKVKNLDEALEIFNKSQHYTYSVAWFDCLARGKKLGKGIILNGEHAKPGDLIKPAQKKAPLDIPRKSKFSIPFFFPPFVMNRLSIKAFNILWYAKGKTTTHIIDYDSYFYPLDGIHHWNRVYGKRGFAQYQFVIPPEKGVEGLHEILNEVANRKLPSFLTVLKWMGEHEGLMSFPKKGYTVAMDFPRTKKLFRHLDALDELVMKYGGRLYLAKDSRMTGEMLRKTYPEFEEWNRIRQELDPDGVMASLQSKRLGL